MKLQHNRIRWFVVPLVAVVILAAIILLWRHCENEREEALKAYSQVKALAKSGDWEGALSYLDEDFRRSSTRETLSSAFGFLTNNSVKDRPTSFGCFGRVRVRSEFLLQEGWGVQVELTKKNGKWLIKDDPSSWSTVD